MLCSTSVITSVASQLVLLCLSGVLIFPTQYVGVVQRGHIRNISDIIVQEMFGE
jgi:hypothetical protein